MIVIEDANLSDYTTFKMGGLCKRLWIPQNEDDVTDIWNNHPNAFNYIIGNGSNILVNDNLVYNDVICTKKLYDSLYVFEDGKYRVGAGVSLQRLIQYLLSDSHGGIEFLSTVPGSVGGALYMNAGRGRKYNLAISEYVEKVCCFIDGKIKIIDRNECEFGYRESAFMKMSRALILYAYFNFPLMEKSEIQNRINARLHEVNRFQDKTMYNMGSVFKTYVPEILDMIAEQGNEQDSIYLSDKNHNWMVNNGNGNFEEAKLIINNVEQAHSRLGYDCELEIIVWE